VAWPVTVAALSKALVCNRSLAGIVGSKKKKIPPGAWVLDPYEFLCVVT